MTDPLDTITAAQHRRDYLTGDLTATEYEHRLNTLTMTPRPIEPGRIRAMSTTVGIPEGHGSAPPATPGIGLPQTRHKGATPMSTLVTILVIILLVVLLLAVLGRL